MKDAYRAILEQAGLLPVATGPRPDPAPIGGISQAQTDEHFCHAFDGSLARVQLAYLDPMESLPITSDKGDAAIIGLAVFIANGVSVRVADAVDNEILRVTAAPIEVQTMRDSRGFLRELTCLHGEGSPRHPETLGTAFDVAQDISFDAIGVDYGYSI